MLTIRGRLLPPFDLPIFGTLSPAATKGIRFLRVIDVPSFDILLTPERADAKKSLFVVVVGGVSYITSISSTRALGDAFSLSLFLRPLAASRGCSAVSVEAAFLGWRERA